MRILFVKLSSIGDVVHTLPTLAAVKRALPDADISWVVEKRSAEILRNNSLLSRLIEVDTKALRHKAELGKTLLTARQQLRELRVSDFDLAIDFQGLLKSAAISKLSKAPRRFGFSKEFLREPASRFLLTDKIEVRPRTNIISKNIDLAENSLRQFFGDENFALDDEGFEFPINTDETHKAEAVEIEKRLESEFVILNPAGGWATKLWNPKKYGELADKIYDELGLASVVSTAPNEIALANSVLRGSKVEKTIVAQPTLKGFYELAKRAQIYIGGDTAPTHLAVAAKCPVVGIFGPTEWWRNGSMNTKDICVERKEIDCREDCHRRTCDKWICMDISVETVFQAVKRRLENVL